MARWRQSPELLATVILAGLTTTGCDVMNSSDVPATSADSKAVGVPARDAFFSLIDTFMKSSDPIALIESHNAVIDRSFAPNGSYAFTATGLAEPGSEIIVPTKGEATPLTMTLIPPRTVPLTLAHIKERYGAEKSIPALPNQGWRYIFKVAGGKIVVALTSNPDVSTSLVKSISAMRES